MTFESYYKSVSNEKVPAVNNYLKALWFDKKGDWNSAHEIVQDIGDRKASWVHAYLHRKEGDLSNASYWYNHAGKTMPSYSLDEEWESLSKYFLKDENQ